MDNITQEMINQRITGYSTGGLTRAEKMAQMKTSQTRAVKLRKLEKKAVHKNNWRDLWDELLEVS